MEPQDPPEEWLMSRRRALWRVAVKKRYDRPDGSRLIVTVATNYTVAPSAEKAECQIRQRVRAHRRPVDLGNGEIMWWDCECERVRWMDEAPRAPGGRREN